MEKVFPLHGEEAARHDRTAVRRRLVVVPQAHSLQLTGADGEPAKGERPVHGAPVRVEAARVGEGLVVDDVDDGADDRLRRLTESVEERLQPAGGRLDVRIEEGQHLTGGRLGADDAPLDEADSAGGTQYADGHAAAGAQLIGVRLQRATEEGALAGVVHEEDLVEEAQGRSVQDAVYGAH